MKTKMKKFQAALIAFDIVMGLLLLCLWGHSKEETYVQTSGSREVSVSENEEEIEIKKVALTFDDGPHPSYTEILLDGLKERGIPATFFVTGYHAELHPDIIKRMQQEGHLIGNHTYSHIQLTDGNREKFKEELILTNEILEEITGEEVVYVRPPYGSWDKRFEKEIHMIPVLWTVDTRDWSSTNVKSVVQRALKETKEDDIILMHDYFETSIEAALEIVDILLEEGYTFVTVEEMLFD